MRFIALALVGCLNPVNKPDPLDDADADTDADADGDADADSDADADADSDADADADSDADADADSDADADADSDADADADSDADTDADADADTDTDSDTDTCSIEEVLFCGDVVGGTTVGAPSQIDQWSCATFQSTGPEVTYRFEPDTTGEATVIVSGLTGDLDVFVTGAGCTAGTCMRSSQLGMQDETMTAAISAGDVYHITLDGFAGATSDYLLRVDCGVPPPPPPPFVPDEVFSGTVTVDCEVFGTPLGPCTQSFEIEHDASHPTPIQGTLAGSCGLCTFDLDLAAPSLGPVMLGTVDGDVGSFPVQTGWGASLQGDTLSGGITVSNSFGSFDAQFTLTR